MNILKKQGSQYQGKHENSIHNNRKSKDYVTYDITKNTLSKLTRQRAAPGQDVWLEGADWSTQGDMKQNEYQQNKNRS